MPKDDTTYNQREATWDAREATTDGATTLAQAKYMARYVALLKLQRELTASSSLDDVTRDALQDAVSRAKALACM